MFKTLGNTLAIALFLVGVAQCDFPSTAERQAQRERAAATYAKKMGVEYKGLNCTASDSDGDGNVSCDIMQKNGEVMQIECHWKGTCKSKAGKVQVGKARNAFGH